MVRLSAICLVSLGAMLIACTTVPPAVSSPPPFPLALGGVHVTVNRVEHQAAVIEGLRRAGIPVAEDARDLSYVLRADVGKAQAVSERCGHLRNLRYTLNYAILPNARTTGQHVTVGGQAIQMLAKGYDGDCHPNGFDEMGTALRKQMTGKVKVIDADGRFLEKDPRFGKLRTHWVHSTHASDSDVYFSNRRECMEESSVVSGAAGSPWYDTERFDVCMQSLGWRSE